jgi:hypothetical protein
VRHKRSARDMPVLFPEKPDRGVHIASPVGT